MDEATSPGVNEGHVRMEPDLGEGAAAGAEF